jgi:thioester reductase-like protein
MAELSIKKTLAGKHILLTGASGFLGKVWLAMVLDRVPDIGRISVLLRKKGLRPARDRFEKMLGSSPAFKPLHERHGAKLGAYISKRVKVIDGDVTQVDLGMSAEAAGRLKRDVDLVVNCAGLVEFDPDLRDALDTNVDGAVNALEFTRQCANARLVHVSTVYVTGRRDGTVSEELIKDFAPQGDGFCAEDEYRAAREALDQLKVESATPEAEIALCKEVLAIIEQRGLDESNDTLVRNMTHRHRQQRLRNQMADEGMRRAQKWGWPNTYTYSKSLAESLLVDRAGDVPMCVVRPAIVESAASFPFPGWNEGFNTCGPLTYLMATWFRNLPAAEGNFFDVVPVDLVCNLITIASSAILRGEHAPVYQAGTSDRNPLTIDRACELTGLAHRKHLRTNGTNAVERVIRSRFDSVITEGKHLMQIGNIRSFAKGVEGLFRKVSTHLPAKMSESAEKMADSLVDTDKQLDQIEVMIDLFIPFIHDSRYRFTCRALDAHAVVDEEFRFEPETIDWFDYWVNVQIPGLRRWCYPAIEGKKVETYVPETPFKLPSSATATEVAKPSVQVRSEVG